jgi:hypothetical protein
MRPLQCIRAPPVPPLRIRSVLCGGDHTNLDLHVAFSRVRPANICTMNMNKAALTLNEGRHIKITRCICCQHLDFPPHHRPTRIHDSMDGSKVAQSHVDSEPSNFGDATEKGGTSADTRDMLRMGKMQETRRNFHRITILGFCMVILSTWEAILSTSVFALANGGTAVCFLRRLRKFAMNLTG